MAIVDCDGFNFLDGEYRDYIVVEDQRLVEYENYIQMQKVEGIYLTSLYYSKDDIDFIEKIADLKKLNLSISLRNYEVLYYLDNLEELHLEDPKGEVDLTRFKKLKRLSLYNVTKHVIGLENCNQLIQVTLWKYKPKLINLEELSSLIRLNNLTLIQGTISSLKGCQNLSDLTKLELTYLSKLTHIDDIVYTEQLKVLSFESCKNIDDFTCIKNLEKLSLINCGEIASLKFISELPNLKLLVFSKTNVVDGDLSYCEGIEYVGFDNKKHYTHKMSDFVNAQ